MKEFKLIYLSWRPGSGHGRHLVGVLKRTAAGASFKYLPKNLAAAQEKGFTSYVEFPDLEAEYTENVVETFGSRLMKQERVDVAGFLRFWEVNESDREDKFYMLGRTQGLLPTDNFEFLANYHSKKGLVFITDLAGLSKHNVPAGSIKSGDQLSWKFDFNNEVDKKAIKVFKDDLFVGYVKRVHCNVFHEGNASKLKLVVKGVEQNGTIKRVFVRVSF